MRRTKETLIYRQTKNLRAVQLLLGHSKMESTVRYLSIEVDDGLKIAERIEVQEFQGDSVAAFRCIKMHRRKAPRPKTVSGQNYRELPICFSKSKKR